MRIVAVYVFNDKRRYENYDLKLSEDAIENMIKLLPMCKEPLFIAELHRELGEFEEASQIMKSIDNKDIPIYKLIDKLIKEKSTKTGSV